MFENTFDRYRAFWQRRDVDRPLFGCSISGTYAADRFPQTVQALPSGPLQPEHISTELFLDDCEHQYHAYLQVADDYPFVAAPLTCIPWMEAIMGCPIVRSGTSIWAEPCVENWQNWYGQLPDRDNPWQQKLLELTEALIVSSHGRFPVAPTLMRGPADMLAAMRGAANLPLDLIDCPDLIKRAADICTRLWINIGRAQLEKIPPSSQGYMAGEHGLRTWAPDKVIWLQEDAMALMSPSLYADFFLPLDRRIADEFPCVAFHLHASALWAVDILVQEPAIDVIELNLEAAHCDLEGTLAAWKKIQPYKPLIIWLVYQEDHFASWLEKVLSELNPAGLSIQPSVKDSAEGRKIWLAFLEAAKACR